MRLALRIGVVVLLVLAIAANGGLAAALVATREPAPAPLTGDRIEKASLPAIVLIQSNYKVSTSVPEPYISDSSWNRIQRQLQAMYDAGQIQNTRGDINRAVINIISGNPDAYFSTGSTITDTFDMYSTGSGFFVTEDGYLVTAAHVVSADKAEIQSEVINEVNKGTKFTSDLTDQIKKDWSSYAPTDAQINSLVAFYKRWVTQYYRVNTIDAKYYLASGTVEAGDRLTSTGVRASVVSTDPTTTGHDIAILKASVNGVPTLHLASGAPHFGDATYAIGYPREGYLHETVPLNQTVPPTMTTGKVLSTAAQKTGWDAWGTNAQFTHGASGGPVVGANGDVLGIVSYSIVDAQGKQLFGQGYFVPSQYIKDDLAGDNVKLTPDPKNITNTYYRALAKGDIQRYKDELVLLQDVQTRSPFDAYVKEDIISTQSLMLAGKDKTPPELAGYILPGAGTAGGIILLAVVVWLTLAITGRRRTPAPVPAGAEAAAPAVPAQVVTAPVVPLPATVEPVQATNGEPATEVVSSPQEVLRESETIATNPSASDAPAT